jgi:hypothetical protein
LDYSNCFYFVSVAHGTPSSGLSSVNSTPAHSRSNTVPYLSPPSPLPVMKFDDEKETKTKDQNTALMQR